MAELREKVSRAATEHDVTRTEDLGNRTQTKDNKGGMRLADDYMTARMTMTGKYWTEKSGGDVMVELTHRSLIFVNKVGILPITVSVRRHKRCWCPR